MTINRLVRKAQKGDEKAFLKLFEQYEADIYRMAYVYVKNQEDALDVVQEVAYQTCKHIRTLQKPEFFKTWLMRITMNCAINVARKNKKVVSLTPEYEEILEAKSEDILLSVSLQDVMDVLDEEEKSVVLLRFYHHLTFKEIAKLLNIPLGTAKSILYRALGKLRKQFKGGDFFEQSN